VEIKAWMLDMFDVINGQLIRWCKPCTEKLGFRVYAAIRPKFTHNRKEILAFEKKHYWCGLDREFNIKLIQSEVGLELSDKEKVFIHECMNEGWEKDQIIQHLQTNRHKTPSQSLMASLFDLK